METFAPATPALGCPDREMLIDFDLGKLSARDLDAVARHVASCSPCERSLHALHGRAHEDHFIGRLKQCLGMAPFPDEADDVPTATPSGMALINAFASTLEAGPAGGDRRALEAINKYELLGKIGQGGMGVVYRARQVALNRIVALKMILAGHAASAQTIARFLREGKAVARLRHPNIVQVYELGESEGLPYYTMELVEGRDLKERLADGPFDPREAAELVRTLAEAAEYAHREGVLHRDLKPANILLAADGTPRITDFGLAKWLDAESGEPPSAALTEADAILGTPSYMAPEQADCRSDDIGKTTDVYALGVILYESLTGRPPFVGETKMQTLALVRSAGPVPPSRHRPEIPSWLEAICLKCLEKSPAHRYPSAQALADDLGSWLRDERPRGIPTRLARFGRLLRRHAAALVIGSAVFSAGTASYLLVTAPGRALDRIGDELARGHAVTLVGATGKPRWSRIWHGKPASQVVLAEDDTLRIRSWTTCTLMELLPATSRARYHFSAQIRHDTTADRGSEVGLYFAHETYPGDGRDIHFLTYLGFNALRSLTAEIRARPRRPPIEGLPAPSPKDLPRVNAVKLFSVLMPDEDGPLNFRGDIRTTAGVGPLFDAGLEQRDRWHKIVLEVSPAGVTGRWDGQPFSVSTADLQWRVDKALKMSTLPLLDRPRSPGTWPKFEPRGGLGLFVGNSSASFRQVAVVPLPDRTTTP